MANTDLPPVPYKTPPVGQDGMLTQPWMAWFRQLFVRVGQNSAPSIGALLLSPMTAVGDLIYGGVAGVASRLPGNSAATKKFLIQTGTGTDSAAPNWGTILAADVPTLNQNTTGSAATAAALTGNLTGDVTSLGMVTSYAATVPLNKGGTGQTTKAAAFDALHPMSASGDIIYGGTAGTGTRLPKGSDGQVFTLASGLPSWATPAATPSGMISMYGAATAPTGYLLCDGTAVSRTTYAALFAVISTTYGTGDGSTTFNVPNLKGVFPRGSGSQTISGISYSGTLGTTQGDQFQGHFHDNVSSNNGFLRDATGQGGGNVGGTQITSVTGVNAPLIVATAPVTDGTNGTPRTGSETRPANVCVNFIIKT